MNKKEQNKETSQWNYEYNRGRERTPLVIVK